MKYFYKNLKTVASRRILFFTLIALGSPFIFIIKDKVFIDRDSSSASAQKMRGYAVGKGYAVLYVPALETDRFSQTNDVPVKTEKRSSADEHCAHKKIELDPRMKPICSIRSKLAEFSEDNIEVIQSINFDFWTCARAKEVTAETRPEQRIDECYTAEMSSLELDVEATLAAMPQSKNRDRAYFKWLVAKRNRLEMSIVSAASADHPELDLEIHEQLLIYDATNAQLNDLLVRMSKNDSDAAMMLEALRWRAMVSSG